jgi:hypothetical protein
LNRTGRYKISHYRAGNQIGIILHKFPNIKE